MARTSVNRFRDQLRSKKFKSDGAFGHLINLFDNISRCRRGNGIERLSWSDILDWSVLYDIQLEPWEIDYIVALDGEFISYVKGLKGKEPEGPPPKLSRALRREHIKGRVLQ